MFIPDHSDHVQVLRCISALKEAGKLFNNLLDDGREGEIMPKGGLWDMVWIYCYDYYVLPTLRLGSVLVHVGCGTADSPQTFRCGPVFMAYIWHFCYGIS